MSLDTNFLPKMLYFLHQVDKAVQRTNYVNKQWEESELKQFNSIFTGLCPQFCELVIQKSEFVNTGRLLPLYGGTLSVDQLCGMIPDTEQNRYWFMRFDPADSKGFRIVDHQVFYTLCQHGSQSMWVYMKVDLDDFNRFLTWAFSYLDIECFNAWNKMGE